VGGRKPIRSKEEKEKASQCALVGDQYDALQSEYRQKRSDYDFKKAHPLDAQMTECNLHWRERVCLKRGGSDGGVSYAAQWNESGQELRRKLALEYEVLQKLEQEINISRAKAAACFADGFFENRPDITGRKPLFTDPRCPSGHHFVPTSFGSYCAPD
jgi:hypothetical protein